MRVFSGLTILSLSARQEEARAKTEKDAARKTANEARERERQQSVAAKEIELYGETAKQACMMIMRWGIALPLSWPPLESIDSTRAHVHFLACPLFTSQNQPPN